MPELPEVETIRRELNKKIICKKILNVEILSKKLVQGDLDKFLQNIVGNSFSKIDRIGKLLIFELAQKKEYLLIHLKMTGQLIYRGNGDIVAGGHKLPPITEETKKDFYELPNKHTRAFFIFSDNSKLFFNDLRKFAYMKLASEDEKNRVVKKYGIEPLSENFTLENFKKILTKKRMVKAVLLEQKSIAGIGNIYADEICFEAKVCPDRLANSLSENEIKNLFNASDFVLKEAIKNKGTTFRDYVNANGKRGNHLQFLKVYNRKGEKCLRCEKGIIKKIKVAGRGTNYCPSCQK